jgi:hypothetical protein
MHQAPFEAPPSLPAWHARDDSGPDLVMGLAAGYHYGDVRPFVRSLEETGFSGHCVLFVSPTTRGLQEIAAHGVRLIPFERAAPCSHLPYNALRYTLYRDYLASASCRYRRILITDVRDVVFQHNPFDFRWAAGINVTLEDRRMNIGRCPYMTRWITGHLGDDALRSLHAQPISCSGTTAGCHSGMTAYLQLMLDRLLPFVPANGMAGYDQGVHNFLLHSGILARTMPVTVHDNTGPVLTLGYVEGTPPHDEQGHVAPLPHAERPPYIVHQYDRKPELFRALRARYAPPRKHRSGR